MSQQINEAARLTADDDQLRSETMRDVFLREPTSDEPDRPKHAQVVVQYWNDLSSVPQDVKECLDSWAQVESTGVSRRLFDDTSAALYISENLDNRHVAAFGRCSHPAMRADYFRLCYISIEGGCYIDADDIYEGGDAGRNLGSHATPWLLVASESSRSSSSAGVWNR